MPVKIRFVPDRMTLVNFGPATTSIEPSTVNLFVQLSPAGSGGNEITENAPEKLLALNNGKRLSYGFGLVPGTLGTHKSIGHGGGVNGFTTSSIFFPDDSGK